jgi:hypothetical protein
MAGSDGRSVVPARLPDDFLGRLVVDCPACGGYAVILPCDLSDVRASAARRMVCRDCGAMREKPQTPNGASIDPFMGLAPRFRAVTRHGDLVAWNEEHLDYLETYLSGRVRVEQLPVDPAGPRNRTIVSRLPAWAKSAKNRDDMLRAIERVRRELG